MPKKMPAVPWVTLGPDPALATCQRCDQTEDMPELPLSVDAFVAYMAFVLEKHHRGCTA